MPIPEQYCSYCGETKDLTEEFWHHDFNRDTSFGIKCKVCAKKYYYEHHKKPGWLSLGLDRRKMGPEKFGAFEKECLKEKARRDLSSKPVISIYQEI